MNLQKELWILTNKNKRVRVTSSLDLHTEHERHLHHDTANTYANTSVERFQLLPTAF